MRLTLKQKMKMCEEHIIKGKSFYTLIRVELRFLMIGFDIVINRNIKSPLNGRNKIKMWTQFKNKNINECK